MRGLLLTGALKGTQQPVRVQDLRVSSIDELPAVPTTAPKRGAVKASKVAVAAPGLSAATRTNSKVHFAAMSV